MTKINKNKTLITDPKLLQVMKYVIKQTTSSLINNQKMDINIIFFFFRDFPKFKKSPQALLNFEKLFDSLIKGEVVFYNGQRNAFNKYINEKLYIELKIQFPTLTKEEYDFYLSKILKTDIFVNLLRNESVKRTRTKKI